VANYFKNIPKVSYDINGTEPNNFLSVTNIMKRVKFKPKIIEDIVDYYPYFVKEGERPDIISFNEYGTIAYAYLIMLVNNIYDPLFDWPLSSQQFEKYIESKYGSVSSAMGTTKYFFQIIRAEVARTGVSERVPEVKFIVDETTYNALDVGDRTTQTEYEYEEELNDNKREIRLINPEFIQDIDYNVKTSLVS
tara:strand:+ start:577 stop:1155 length:579 start_codon:yes stop_codon:yes gene_type:complete